MIDLGRIGKTLERLGLRLEKQGKAGHKPKGNAKKKAKRRK